MKLQRKYFVLLTMVLLLSGLITSCNGNKTLGDESDGKLSSSNQEGQIADEVLQPEGLLRQEWEAISSKLGISPEEVYTRELSLTVVPEKSRIDSLNIKFFVPGESGTYYSAIKRSEQEGYLVSSYPAEQEPDVTEYVPLLDLVKELDQVGIQKLPYRAGAYSYLELKVTSEDGKIFGNETSYSSYSLTDGKIEKIIAPELLAVSEKNVIVRTSPVDDRSGEIQKDKNRTYLLKRLSGPSRTVTVEAPALEGEETWMDSKVADVDGDGEEEVVYLIGKKSDFQLPVADQKRLIIGKGERFLDVIVPETETFYGTEFLLRDLTGDGQPEFLFYENLGGSGGIIELNIFQLDKDQLKPVFHAQEYFQVPGMKNEYLGQNRVRIAIPSRELVWEYKLEISTYDIIDKRAEEGIKKTFSADWVDPFSGYDLNDLDGDGTVELIGSQRVCGTAHVDIIADLRQVFYWNGERFDLRNIQLYQFYADGTARGVKPVENDINRY